MRAGILLALLGQMRKGEICALNWEDVDLEPGCIRVKHSAYAPTGDRVEIKAPKTRRSRRQITLPEGVVAALRALQEEQAREKVRVSSLWEDSGAVFVDYTGKRLHPTTIPQRFQKILEENNLPHIRFHDLRHPYVKPTTKKFLSFFKFEMAISLRAFLCFALLLGIKEGPQLVPFIR